ncbi:putative Two-component hybrid sensor and regulator [Fulvivirga imtechensis AK7]|uniref:histidine kinase n=1 Tax=Fulvivirga imtechensis AK7 TaxID=1237149 RepID=L8JRI3_9BACT|nr:PAS domain S-box protein [Fulvivirga imtechensis]ELR70778.1 putative Two-component hybrid sensor and regulator [Fulvivirga imtechensis AK7]
MGEKEIYKAIFASAPDAVVVVDADGKIIMANDRVKMLFGYDKNELIGQSVEFLIPERYRNIHVSHRTNYVTNPNLREMGAGRELIVKRKDGSEFFVEISLSPLETSKGMLTSATLRDVSERIRTRKQLEQSLVAIEKKNKELEHFAYVASHDLREPLHTIMSLVNLIEKEYKGKLDKNADRYLEFILQTSIRMEALIKDLLDYSRIGTEQEQQDVNCNEIVDEVLLDMDALIQRTKTVVERSILPTLKGYPTELRQLFQNLISNAVKFRRPDAY